MIRQNLGKLDRIFRFVLGLWLLSPLKPVFTAPWANWFIVIVGLITLVESFVGWCTLHNWFGINNKSQ